ncbi:type 1 fimbrial protein [Salmonella enterica]|nr:type 1 fimbrial protein [Salmonella enterica]
MRGAVAHSACSITLDSVSQTISFGDIPLSRFSRPGAEVVSVPFSIRVENCALPGHSRQGIDAMNNVAYAGGYTVLARFYGPPVDKEHPDLLGSDTGIAGVGLRLESDYLERSLPVNRLTDPLPLFKGDGKLLFRASLIRYDRAQVIRTGYFAWNVTFEILYQ